MKHYSRNDTATAYRINIDKYSFYAMNKKTQNLNVQYIGYFKKYTNKQSYLQGGVYISNKYNTMSAIINKIETKVSKKECYIMAYLLPKK